MFLFLCGAHWFVGLLDRGSQAFQSGAPSLASNEEIYNTFPTIKAVEKRTLYTLAASDFLNFPHVIVDGR